MEPTEDRSIAAPYFAGIQAIEQALKTPPGEQQPIINDCQCAIARLRDSLIMLYRLVEDAQAKSHVRLLLDQANLALSLMTGAAYPGEGIRLQSVQQALSVLQGMHIQQIQARKESI